MCTPLRNLGGHLRTKLAPLLNSSLWMIKLADFEKNTQTKLYNAIANFDFAYSAFLSFIHSFFFFLTSCLEVRRVRVDNGLSTQCHFSLVLLFFIPYCCSAPGLHPNPFLSSWICLNWMMSSIFDAPTAR